MPPPTHTATLLLLALLPTLATAWDIVRDHKPAASVLLPNPTPPPVQTAADELTNYIFQITGANLPVSNQPVPGLKTIRLGTPVPNTKPDEIRLKITSPDTLELTGDQPRGTLYAVYELLDRLGCRFWSPRQSTIPKQPTISLPDTLDYAYAPPFHWRQAYGEPSLDYRWAVRNRLNGGYWGQPNIPPAWGQSCAIDVGESLTLRWVKSKEHFAKHPEWFAYRNKSKKREPGQLCVSNPEVRSRLLQEVRDYLRQHPETETLSLCGNDSDQYCQCTNGCDRLTKTHGTYAAQLVDLANFVAGSLEREFPRVRYIILAYWTTFGAPKGMKLHPQVEVCCAHLRDFSRTAEEDAYYRDGLYRWRDLAPNKRLWIWDYNACFTDFITALPQFRPIGENMRFYRSLGVQGFVCQMPWGSCSDWVDLRGWLWGRMAWNPDLDEAREIDSWIDGTMGSGAPYMKRQLAAIEAACKGHCGPYAVTAFVKSWLATNAPLALACLDLQNQALAATANEPEAHATVERQSAALLDAIIRAYRPLAKRLEGAPRQLPPRAELVDRLEAIFAKHRCSTYREWDVPANLIKAMRQEDFGIKE